MRWTSCQACRPRSNRSVRLTLSTSRRLAPLTVAVARVLAACVPLRCRRVSRSATGVPRRASPRFRADTVIPASREPRTAHFPVHHCTVLGAPAWRGLWTHRPDAARPAPAGPASGHLVRPDAKMGVARGPRSSRRPGPRLGLGDGIARMICCTGISAGGATGGREQARRSRS
jgi:hypothetical protein